MLMTTLDAIAVCQPCCDGWQALMKLKGLPDWTLPHFDEDDNPFPGDSTLFPVSEIGKLGKLEWLFWTAILVDEKDLKPYIQAAINAAMQVKHLMQDSRSIKAVDAAQNFLDGKITLKKLSSARVAAESAWLFAAAAARAARWDDTAPLIAWSATAASWAAQAASEAAWCAMAAETAGWAATRVIWSARAASKAALAASEAAKDADDIDWDAFSKQVLGNLISSLNEV